MDNLRAVAQHYQRVGRRSYSAIRRYMDDNLVTTCDGAESAGDSRDDRQGDGSCSCLPSWIFLGGRLAQSESLTRAWAAVRYAA
jgi:hypothetical protein